MSWSSTIATASLSCRPAACTNLITSCCSSSSPGGFSSFDPERSLFVSPSWVGGPGSPNPLTHFTTIGAALTRALALAPTSDRPVDLYLFTGTYAESLILVSNVNLTAPGSNVHVQDVTYTPGAGVNAPFETMTERVVLTGLTMASLTFDATAKVDGSAEFFVRSSVVEGPSTGSLGTSLWTMDQSALDTLTLTGAGTCRLSQSTTTTINATGSLQLDLTNVVASTGVTLNGTLCTAAALSIGATGLTLNNGATLTGTSVTITGPFSLSDNTTTCTVTGLTVGATGLSIDTGATLTATAVTVAGSVSLTTGAAATVSGFFKGNITVTEGSTLRLSGSQVSGTTQVGVTGDTLVDVMVAPGCVFSQPITVNGHGHINVMGSQYPNPIATDGSANAIADQTHFITTVTTDASGNKSFQITPPFSTTRYTAAITSETAGTTVIPNTTTMVPSQFGFHAQANTSYQVTLSRVSSTVL